MAIFASHPVQYHTPLYQALAGHPLLDLTVYYGSRWGATDYFDRGFGRRIRWDVDLLEGYRFRFLRNFSPCPSPEHFWGLLNVGLLAALAKGSHHALLIHGYAHASSWLAVASAWATGTPCLFRGEAVLRPSPSSLGSRFKSSILRRLFRRFWACLAIGSRATEFYLAHGVPPNRIHWVPYAIDQKPFGDAVLRAREGREALRADLRLSKDLPVVLCVAKLIPRKRPLDLLQAISRLRRPAALLLVGDGPLREKIAAFARRHPLLQIRWLGFKNQTELPAYYGLADLFVLPSAYEPWGIVINEACAAGLPVVTTTAVAAAADLVRPGENGFLYPPGDVALLTRLLEQLLSDPALRSRMGQRSEELILPWSAEAGAAEIARLCESLLDGSATVR